MTIKLFNISQKQNVANKIKNASPVYTGDVSPYMGVTNKGASFILDKGYTCNYGVYSFLGKTYYCYVTTSVNSDGLYLYEFNIDALATCYYNGAFNGNQYVERDSIGNDKIFDMENPCNPYIERTVEFIADQTTDIRVVLNILYPYNSYTPSSNEHYVGNRNITTYVLTTSQFADFNTHVMTHIDDSYQNRYMKSIVSSFIVDSKFIDDDMLINTGDNKVNLFLVNENNDGSISGFPVPVTGDVYRIKRNTSSTTMFAKRYTTSMNIPIDNISVGGNFQLIIRNIGKIVVKLSDLNIKNESAITSIGYSVSVNYLSGTYIAYLVVNDYLYRDYMVSSPIKEQALLAYDSSVSRWTDYSSSALGAISGAVSTGVGIATMNPIAIMGGAMSLANAGVSAINVANAHEQGGYSVSGALGGNDDYQMNNIRSIVIFSRCTAINKSAYENLFGKPVYTVKNINGLTGYIKTRNCKFDVALPVDIVREGETSVDEGIYVI